MAPGRAWLRERAAGKRVLNLFSFTCAFSVAALAGGAERVVNIDLSRPALALGQANQAANGFGAADVHYLPHNVFRSWKKLHSLGRYDLIVADPPSAQKGSFQVERDYAKVLRRLPKLLAPEAELLICLNAPWLEREWLQALVADNLPGATLAAVLPGAPASTRPPNRRSRRSPTGMFGRWTLHPGRGVARPPFRERREPIPGAPGLTSCQTGSRKGGHATPLRGEPQRRVVAGWG